MWVKSLRVVAAFLTQSSLYVFCGGLSVHAAYFSLFYFMFFCGLSVCAAYFLLFHFMFFCGGLYVCAAYSVQEW